MKKVLVFLVTYNAEKTVQQVLSRIPSDALSAEDYSLEVLVIDDCSEDKTFEEAQTYKNENCLMPLTILKNPANLRYGGNQKLGYRYAIEHGYDIVALLHGDGQYAPEELPRLLAPLVAGECDAVFGSRMMPPGDPLGGGNRR